MARGCCAEGFWVNLLTMQMGADTDAPRAWTPQPPGASGEYRMAAAQRQPSLPKRPIKWGHRLPRKKPSAPQNWQTGLYSTSKLRNQQGASGKAEGWDCRIAEEPGSGGLRNTFLGWFKIKCGRYRTFCQLPKSPALVMECILTSRDGNSADCVWQEERGPRSPPDNIHHGNDCRSRN